MASSAELALAAVAPAHADAERELPAPLRAHVEALLADGFARTTPRVASPNFMASVDGEMRCYFHAARRRLVAFAYFGARVQGPPGLVHGGALFTVVDFALAVCVARACNCLGFTANISINYRAPARLCGWAVVDARIDRVEKEKKVFLTFAASTIKAAAGPAAGTDTVAPPPPPTKETTLVDGTSLFILNLKAPSSI